MTPGDGERQRRDDRIEDSIQRDIEELPTPLARHVVTATPEEVVEQATEAFLERLEAWLVSQREWPLVAGLAPRKARRRMAQQLAQFIVTIPAREGQVGNRQLRRQVAKNVGAFATRRM